MLNRLGPAKLLLEATDLPVNLPLSQLQRSQFISPVLEVDFCKLDLVLELALFLRGLRDPAPACGLDFQSLNLQFGNLLLGLDLQLPVLAQHCLCLVFVEEVLTDLLPLFQSLFGVLDFCCQAVHDELIRIRRLLPLRY